MISSTLHGLDALGSTILFTGAAINGVILWNCELGSQPDDMPHSFAKAGQRVQLESDDPLTEASLVEVMPARASAQPG